jgi:maleate isomerase
VLKRLISHYTGKYGLEVVAGESFSGSDSVLYPGLGQELARDAIARTDRPEIEIFIVAGGNFPNDAVYIRPERAVGKPVITTNQAALWAMIQIMRADEKFPSFGRLLEEMPAI